MAKMLKITQVRSVIGSQERKHKRVMRALGFRRNYRTLYKNDTPQIRGMINMVRHLVAVEETDAPAAADEARGAGFTVVERAPERGAAAETAADTETARG